MERLTRFMAEYYKKHGNKGYILKYDIRHYFDSIDHDVLEKMLLKVPDDDVRELLYKIIDSYSVDGILIHESKEVLNRTRRQMEAPSS